MRDEQGGGISELEANRRDRSTCDAFFLIRALIDDEQVTMLTTSLEGHQMGPISVTMLYRMWVSMAGFIAKKADPEDPEEKRAQRFCGMILKHLEMNDLLEAAGFPATPAAAAAEAGADLIRDTLNGASALPPAIPVDDEPTKH